MQTIDPQLVAQHLGGQIRQKRRARGLTQEALSTMAGLTRQKVIAVEKGNDTVSMSAYARVLRALECELLVRPAMPTLDEVQALFEQPGPP